MSEYANRFKIGDFTPRGLVDPKFQVDGVIPTNHSSSQKTQNNGYYAVQGHRGRYQSNARMRFPVSD